MKERTIRLHMFCSVKGGVGKSSLAIMTAKLLAAQGRVCALLDCDLSGTSLADGLRLRAPHVTLEEDGAVDVRAAPTGKWYSVEESREQRADRRNAMQTDDEWKARPHPPPYLNDALNFAYAAKEEPWDIQDRVARMDALSWRHEDDDGILYFPSSSVHDDVQLSMGWVLEEPFDFAHALALSLDALAKRVPLLTDVVLDLPPGIWGFPHEALLIAYYLESGMQFPPEFPQWHEGNTQWLANPFMVTSQDPNDFIPALEYIALHDEKLPNLRPVVNRTTEGMETIKAEVRKRLGPVLAATNLEERLCHIGTIPALSKLFYNGNLDVKNIPREVAEILRIKEAS